MTIKAHYDGKVFVPDEPVLLNEGQRVEITVPLPTTAVIKRGGSGAEILAALGESDPIWQDVGDSVEFARKLRKDATPVRFTIDPD